MANYDSTPAFPSIKIVLGAPAHDPAVGSWMRPASLRGALGVFELPDIALTAERPSADDVRAAVLRTVAEVTDHTEDPATVPAERLWAECDFAVFAAVVRAADVAFDDVPGIVEPHPERLRGRIVLGPRIMSPESIAAGRPCGWIPARLVHPLCSGSWEHAVAFDDDNEPTPDSIRVDIAQSVLRNGCNESVDPSAFGRMAPAVAAFRGVLAECVVVNENDAPIESPRADPLRRRYDAFLDAARAAFAANVDALFDATADAEIEIDLGPDVGPMRRADGIPARVAVVDDRIVVEIGEERLTPAQVRELHERLSAANVYDGPQTVDEILGTAPTPARPAETVDVPRIVLGPSETHKDSTAAAPLFVRRAELHTSHGRYRLPSVLVTSERPTSAEVVRELLADLESVAPAGASTPPADAAAASFADLLRSSAVVIDGAPEMSPESSALRSLVSAVLAADRAPDDAPNLDALIGAVDSSAVAIDLGPDEIELSLGGTSAASLEFSGAAERLAVVIGTARISIPQARRLYGALARCGAFTAPETLQEMRAGDSRE